MRGCKHGITSIGSIGTDFFVRFYLDRGASKSLALLVWAKPQPD